MEASPQRSKWRRAAWAVASALATTATVPAAASGAGLVVAYDRYETGRGFEISLANAATGAGLTIPTGVNTTDDELHPALSVDGRYLLFDRMRLLPKLNGDIVAPAERTVNLLDRQTGVITSLATGNGPAAGATFANRTPRAATWGVRPTSTSCCILKFQALNGDNTISGSTGFPLGFAPPAAGRLLDAPHAALESNPTNLYLSWVETDANTGALLNSGATLVGLREGSTPRTDFSSASHPVARRGDQYVALDTTSGADADIQTISFPSETQLTPAPSPITTSDPERMPAWSPGGLQLGFVRSAGGRRKLAIFALTPGLQTIVNPPVDIGAEPPSAQTRAFQDSWGGLSLAESSSLDLPLVTCDPRCLSSLQGSLLKPKLSTTTKGQTVGIFVARVTGTRKLLGRRVPRIRPVGRVPLGRTRKGTNRFRWNRKVNGRRLKAGKYLLTYRALRRKRVVGTSSSIRFTVTGKGRIRGVRRQR
jgi:hypothetical protein